MFIEPNSYNFNYEDLYRNYWRKIDSRQLIKSTDMKLSLNDTSQIINNFDQIYIDEMLKNNLLVINGKKIKFPKWSL